MRRMLRNGWQPVVAIVVILGIWEVSTDFFDIEEWFLPAPSVIYAEALEVFPTFLPHAKSTILLAISGFAIGVSFGLLLAAGLHIFPFMRSTFYPLIVLSQNIPIIVLAPLLIIWFGFGAFPKLILITLACFFPVAVSTLGGLSQTDRELRHYMKMMGATKYQLFWKLELPYAIPSIFSGVKIAATYSVMAAVISEWLGGQKGIGVFMTLATSSFRTSRVFVAIVVIMAVSMLFFACIVLIERWMGRFSRGGDER